MSARDWWSAAFVVAIFTPVVLRLFSHERQSVAGELVTLSGLLAAVLLVVVVVLPSRLRSLTRSFGIELVMQIHRVLGLSVALMVIGHIVVVVAGDPRGVGLLVPFLDQRAPEATVAPVPLLVPLLTPPARALAGLAATVGLVALSAVSSRKPTQRYETWRRWHLVLAIITLLGTAVHVILIGHLIPTGPLLAILLRDPIGWVMLRAAAVDPVSAGFLVLLALVVLAVFTRRWLLRPLNHDTRYEVAQVRLVAPTVYTLELHPAGRYRGPAMRPGQFAWIRLHQDPFAEEHPFTVSSAAQDRHTIEFTIRSAGDWTDKIKQLAPGDHVWLDGPHGAFTPDVAATEDLVLIAGGVGIAPMMSILRSAAAAGRYRTQRAIRLILTDRPGRGLFLDELYRMTGVLDLSILELHGSALTTGTIADLVSATSEPDYYVCGPPSLVSAAVHALDDLHVPEHRIHTERFDI